MTEFKREALLLEPVSKYIGRKGFRLQRSEVPFYEYRIDVYGVSPSRQGARRTVAIELKLDKWREALRQAIIYQLCADYVFIALPLSVCKRVKIVELEKYGVGLLAVRGNGQCSVLLDATISESLNMTYRNSYVEWMVEARNA